VRNIINELLYRADDSKVGITIFDNEHRLIGYNLYMANIYPKADFCQTKNISDIMIAACNNNEINIPAACKSITDYIMYVIAYHESNLSGQFIRKIADGRIFMMTHQKITEENIWYQTRQDITKDVLTCQVSLETLDTGDFLQAQRKPAAQSIMNILNTIPGAAALVGHSGKIIGINDAFYQFIKCAEGIKLIYDCIVIENSVQQLAFRNNIVDLLGSHLNAPVLLRISRPDGVRPYFLRLSRLNITEENLWRSNRSAVLLTVIDPDQQRVIDPGILATLMGITPAEAEVAAALTSGMSVQEISEIRNVSTNTISHQIKSILNKTGLRSKIDIVRQVIYFTTMIGNSSFYNFMPK
jgi:DNA-binding CsgD family transcriptional regulator